MSSPQNDSSRVRVRFAPSPTGFLHIGGVRTALFNWLYARKHGGEYMLRIEDTDLERSEDRFTQDILASMKWLGLTWDGELVYQSKRADAHLKRVQELLDKGSAYKCYCSEAELEEMRAKATAEGRKPKYDGRCRERKSPPSADAPYVVRVKLPQEGSIVFDDLIRGRIETSNQELDDFIIVRSNGSPTYNFVVVVDDVDMGMTHIIRGDDHINNTPKQLHLYDLLGYPVPKFAHLAMILGADKKKLSKRHGDVSANYYRGEGFLPEAMLNFLVRLGWSHGDQEIFSLDEMIRLFDFSHVQSSPAVFDVDKLMWLNGHYIREADPVRLAKIVKDDFESFFSEPALARLDSSIGVELVRMIQPKVKTLREMTEQLVPLCTPGTVEVDPSELKWNKKPELKPVLKNAVAHVVEHLSAKVKDTPPVKRTGGDAAWGSGPTLADVGMGPNDVDAFLRQLCDQHGVKLGDLTQPMRLCVTGRMVSAGLFELLGVIPWELAEARLRKVAEL